MDDEVMIPISKVEWVEDYKKLANEYKIDERNLIQTFLQNDFHLSKIHNQLLRADVDQERKQFSIIEKQLKFFINEAFSYLSGDNVTRANNNEFKNKIKKIDDFLMKIRKDFKNKFDNLLTEEEKLEKELLNYDENFEKDFGANNGTISSTSNNETFPIEHNEEVPQGEDLFQGAKNKKYVFVDLYITNIMNQNSIVYSPDEKLLYLNDLEKNVKKFNVNDIEVLKEKTLLLDTIVDKKLGGINLGWPQKEHEEFMKLKIAHNGKINTYDFLNNLSDIIPYLPRTELKNHIKIYDKFSHLMEVKKILIKKYKDLKAEIDEEEKKKVLERLNSEKQKRLQSAKEARNFDRAIIDKKKMQVKEWKEKKEKMENEAQIKEQQELKKQKEREREKYLIQKERNQGLIEEFKKKKEIEKQNKIRESMNAYYNQVDYNAIDLDRIREREEALLEKKKKGVRARTANKRQAEDVLYQMKLMSVNKIRPDNKINEVTENYKKRQRAKFDPKNDKGRDACTMANNLLNRGARAIPLWRKGL